MTDECFNPNKTVMRRDVHGRIIGLDWESTRPAVVEETEEVSADNRAMVR